MNRHVPVHAKVVCRDGAAGTSAAILVDPATLRLVNLVVREDRFPFVQRLVPSELVTASDRSEIQLVCSRGYLSTLRPFRDVQVIDVGPGDPEDALVCGDYLVWSRAERLEMDERIPNGEVVLHAGDHVDALDGSLGRIEGVVLGESREVTHLIVAVPHLAGRRDIAVPIGHITLEAERPVFVRLHRDGVAALAHVRHRKVDKAITAAAWDLRSPVRHRRTHGLIAEGPAAAGLKRGHPDRSHLEGAHLLADEASDRLRRRGFSDEQILAWAETYLRAEKTGDADAFVAWIRAQEHAIRS